MPSSTLSHASIRAALSALRHPQSASPLHATPLLRLDLVGAELAEAALPDSVENRAWALGQFLDRLVRERLTLLRVACDGDSHGGGDAPAVGSVADPPRPDAERRQLALDFRAGNIELEAWSLLFTRYLSPNALSMGEVQDIASIGHSTAARRLQRGLDGLLNVLREREAATARARGGKRDGLEGRGAAVTRDDRDGPVGREAHVARDEHAGRTIDATSPSRAVHRPPGSQARGGAHRPAIDVPAGNAVGQTAFVVGSRPPAVAAYLRERIAEWAEAPHELSRRYVEPWLTAIVEEPTPLDQLQLRTVRRRGLAALLDDVTHPVVVVLGAPGDGKSTLLRRHEAATAAKALDDDDAPVPFQVPLSGYGWGGAVDALPQPRAWLAERWAARRPALPPLAEFLAAGQAVLLLDALNEIPHRGEADLADRVRLWKRFAHEVADDQPGNRIIFSCRSLDYFQPLSTPGRRVPQITVEPLDDEQVQAFLGLAVPERERASAAWRMIEDSGQVDLVRSPYFLQLLAAHVDADDAAQLCRATLLTQAVRRALRREIERDHPLLRPGPLLTAHDCLRLSAPGTAAGAASLPEGGTLLPALARLACGLQEGHGAGEPARLRTTFDGAVALAGVPDAAAAIEAGQAIGVLTDVADDDGLQFSHQLMQEYFAARAFARAPDFRLLHVPVGAAEIEPDLATTVAALATADPLPPAPETAWATTVQMAAVLAGNPDGFTSAVAEANLVLAARCAAQPSVRLSEAVRDNLRWRLIARTRDEGIDLRARIAAGDALGLIGDPRYARGVGPDGAYLLPPFVDVPAGEYTIGSDGSIYPEEAPEHRVRIDAFRLAQFPVTRAEWSLFMAAGGYEDERWWDTAAAAAWRRGEGTGEGARANVRDVLARYRAQPGLLDAHFAQGAINEPTRERWGKMLALTITALEAELRETFPDMVYRAPHHWSEDAAIGPAHPLVGITWHEARAYARWLSHQLGWPVRLPSEAEWEASARGPDGHAYPFGDRFDAWLTNTVEAHVRRTTPVGVFPGGDAPCGAADMTGNVCEWTTSIYDLARPYPYAAGDGREAPDTPAAHRVQRGGAWMYDANDARAACRFGVAPAMPSRSGGMRLAADRPAPSS